MKKLIAIFFTVFIAYSFGQAQEIEWYSWKDGYKIAKKENKKMLVFVQTDWCHWCKRMEDKTFNNDEIFPTINNDFIAIKFNVEQKGTLKYEGKEYNAMELISKLSNNEFRGIPATLFFDSNTNDNALEVGFLTPEEMTPLLKKYSKEI